MLQTLLPPDLHPAAAAVLVIVSFFTSALTATFGIGGGIAMLAALSFYMPVAALIPVHGAVQLGSNAGRAVMQRAEIAWPQIGAFLAGGIIGAGLGSRIVVSLPETILQLVLGSFIIVITWVKFSRMRAMNLAGFAATGAVTTFASMFFGATGPLNAAAFDKSFDDRKTLVASLAAVMTIQHLLKIIAFGLAGFAFHEWLPLVAAMTVTGLVGTRAGLVILGRLPEEMFRTGLKWLLTLIALDMLWRGIDGLL
jgi:uncharacterized protein